MHSTTQKDIWFLKFNRSSFNLPKRKNSLIQSLFLLLKHLILHSYCQQSHFPLLQRLNQNLLLKVNHMFASQMTFILQSFLMMMMVVMMKHRLRFPQNLFILSLDMLVKKIQKAVQPLIAIGIMKRKIDPFLTVKLILKLNLGLVIIRKLQPLDLLLLIIFNLMFPSLLPNSLLSHTDPKVFLKDIIISISIAIAITNKSQQNLHLPNHKTNLHSISSRTRAKVKECPTRRPDRTLRVKWL